MAEYYRKVVLEKIGKTEEGKELALHDPDEQLWVVVKELEESGPLESIELLRDATGKLTVILKYKYLRNETAEKEGPRKKNREHVKKVLEVTKRKTNTLTEEGIINNEIPPTRGKISKLPTQNNLGRIYCILPQNKTREDAMRFFARYGSVDYVWTTICKKNKRTYVYIQYIKAEDAIAAHYSTEKNMGTRFAEPRTNEAKTVQVLYEACGYLVLEETFTHHLEACKIQLR